MHSLERRFQQEWKTAETKKETRAIILGVSGGADSVALLRIFHAMQKSLKQEVIVAHFDHQTRQGESLKDAQWVAKLASHLNLPCILGSPSSGGTIPRALTTSDSRSEETLREQRLQFLCETAKSKNATSICLAHHADDQAETILHHIIRGTGLQGLQGIPFCRPLTKQINLLHPMLAFRRSEILDYLQSLEQDFLTDASNKEEKQTRNRIRHQILPMLNELNSQVSTHLIQLSQQAGQSLDYIHAEVDQVAQEVVISSDSDENFIRLNATLLKKKSLVIIREFLRHLWIKQNWSRKKMTSHQWEKLAQFATQSKQTRLDLPANITAIKRGEMLILEHC